MDWQDVPAVIDDWLLKAAAPAQDMRRAAVMLCPSGPVGFYYHPDQDRVAAFAPLALPEDQERVKAAVVAATGTTDDPFLTYQDLADPQGCWIKVAYSHALRRLGEYLNFFPGQYPGGIPNAPSPLAAMLTSGLVGAGLGWGAGKILSRLLPERFGHNLGRSGLVLGGLLGAAPGAAWAGTNYLSGRPLNDATLLNTPPTTEPASMPALTATDIRPEHTPGDSKLMRALGSLPVSGRYKLAVDAFVKLAEPAFGQTGVESAADVNIDVLGRTLWETGASPALAATAMSGLYAAQQLPDRRSRPGWATGGQLGQLAMNTMGDYARGLLVGAALNTAIGTPLRASTYGLGNMALGIIGAVVPKLFGD